MYPLPLKPPSPQPTPLGHHSAPGWAPCGMYQLPTICFAHNDIYMSVALSQFIPSSSQVHSLLGSSVLFF